MKISVNTASPLGIKDQIKRQIRGLIESGHYKPGSMLTPSRDLAKTLGVNRNTVWAAYRELTDEGWLRASVGSGTYVKDRKMSDQRRNIGNLFDEMLSKAESMGYDSNEVVDRFLNHVASLPPNTISVRRLLVVECNHETGIHIAGCLKKELKVQTKVMLIQEIEENPIYAKRQLREIDLVVCGFNHLNEFRAAMPDSPVEAVGILMKPDLKALDILQGLPSGTTVGLTCANRRSTETLYRDIIYDNGSSLKRIWVGMDDEAEIREMLKKCHVVLASHYVYNRVKEMAPPRTEVVKVELCPDPVGISMVRDHVFGK